MVANLLSRMDYKDDLKISVAEPGDFPLLPAYIRQKQVEEEMEVDVDMFKWLKVDDIDVIVAKDQNQMVIPKSIQVDIMSWLHECCMHPGISRMQKSLKDLFWWNGMGKDIQKFVNRCQICRKNKINKKK